MANVSSDPTPASPSPTENPRAFVFSPSPLLTVTVETAPDGRTELHVHPGGQGFWIGRMATLLGMDVHLSGPFGGETGNILVDLIGREGLTVHPVHTGRDNGSYIHDRRDGERTVVAEVPPPPLTRHEIDDLFSTSLAAAMGSHVAILGGPHCDEAVPSDIYRRLCADLSALEIPVFADLSGPTLTAALEGGVTVLKVSHEDLIEDGRAASEKLEDLVAAMKALHEEGAETVVISRAGDPALASNGDGMWEIESPPVQIVDHHGAGDSMSAGMAFAFASGMAATDLFRIGAAAGAVNVTRRGLATGEKEAVTSMADHVSVRPLEEVGRGEPEGVDR